MTPKERKLIEQSFIDRIQKDCPLSAFEENGYTLDGHLDDFLREIGFIRLADTVKAIECWRS